MTQQFETCTRCGVHCVPFYSIPGEYVLNPNGDLDLYVGPNRQTHWCHMCWMQQHVCLDCKWNTHVIHEYYRVTNEVWLQAVPGNHGMLCVGCLEKRLGRELTPADFELDVPINHNSPMWPKSDRLMKRMGYLVDN